MYLSLPLTPYFQKDQRLALLASFLLLGLSIALVEPSGEEGRVGTKLELAVVACQWLWIHLDPYQSPVGTSHYCNLFYIQVNGLKMTVLVKDGSLPAWCLAAFNIMLQSHVQGSQRFAKLQCNM